MIPNGERWPNDGFRQWIGSGRWRGGTQTQRRRARSVFLLSFLALAGMIFLSDLVRFADRDAVGNAADAIGGHERRLDGEGDLTEVADAPDPPKRALRTLALLPRHALQHRQRRELVAREMQVPQHLREGEDDEMYHAHQIRRRRMQRRRRMAQDGEGGVQYETGALYQGYGTHYLDLWVGSPTPQRQTVIVDTGSHMTAFPCSGCQSCGSDSKWQYHIDADFDTNSSSTYEEKACNRGERDEAGKVTGYVPCDFGSCVGAAGRCQVSVSYAEGSSWTAVEGSDVVYPAGPHDAALEMDREARLDAGVGAGMGNLGGSDEGGEEFDWMDFRLKFGCQKRVTGMFQKQLADGIMGMDRHKGSFWAQLHEHYKSNGHAAGSPSEQGGDGSAEFDPTQFSLCYDRQPMSMDLRQGVGSGALTLGGTDPLLHGTDMVFAENTTPGGERYPVLIKAMFLRTGGGTLAEPHQGAVEYVRVGASQGALNGKDSGVIIDSGTTDTYLHVGLQAPFNAAWKKAMGDASEYFHNQPRRMTPEEFRSLPTLLFVLKGHSSNPTDSKAPGMAASHKEMLESKAPSAVSESDVVVAVPPTHYMEESNKEPGVYRARLYFNERYGGVPTFGSNAMMGHEINFDIGRGRIGFAESHCDYERYVQERDAKQQELLEQQNQEGEENATTQVAETKTDDGEKNDTQLKNDGGEEDATTQVAETKTEDGEKSDAQLKNTVVASG